MNVEVVHVVVIHFKIRQNKSTPSVINEDEAIKQVIIDESTAWAKRDTTAYFDAFAKNEITQGAWNNRNLSYGVYSGFETLQKSVRDNIKSNPTPSYGTNMERTNWLIKLLSPEWAWVNYTQKTTTVRGIVSTSYETRLMHKEGGAWRINVVNALFFQSTGRWRKTKNGFDRNTGFRENKRQMENSDGDNFGRF